MEEVVISDLPEPQGSLRSEQIDKKDKELLASERLGLPVQLPVLRQSSIETYLQCPRKFLFQQRFGLVPRQGDRSRALDIGTMFHAFMEDFFLGNPEDATVLRLGTWIDEKVSEVLEKELEGKWFGRSSHLVNQDLESEMVIARAMFREYSKVYPLHPERYEILDVEKKIQLSLEGYPGKLGGTLDLLLRDKKTDELWLIDHKTTSLSPMDRARTISYELQPQIYRLLAHGILGKAPVGICHNIIRVPGFKMSNMDRDWDMRPLKSGPRKGELIKEYKGPPKFENFLARVSDWYNARGDYEGNKDEWLRNPPLLQSWTRFDSELIPPELGTVLYEAGRAANAEPRLSRFYRVSKSCYLYNRPCPYLSLCRATPSMWKAKVRDEYDVVNVRGDEE